MAATDFDDRGNCDNQLGGGSDLGSNFRFRTAELYQWCHRRPDSSAGLGVLKADPAEKVKTKLIVF